MCASQSIYLERLLLIRTENPVRGSERTELPLSALSPLPRATDGEVLNQLWLTAEGSN